MSERVARVSQGILEVLASEIPKLKDPRVGFVTVTNVDITPDLRKAHVNYTVLGDEKAQKGTAAGLRSATKHLRAVIGKSLRLRYTPELHFRKDEGVENLQRVDELLKEAYRNDG